MVYKESRWLKHWYREKHEEDTENKRFRNTKDKYNTVPKGWELPASAREDHVPALDNISPAADHYDPLIAKVGEG